MRRASSLVIVRRSDNHVLIGYNNKYKAWCIPGGKCEKGEDYPEAAIRECMEETNILPYRVKPVDGLFTSKDGGFYIKLFLIETEAEALTDGREFREFKWIPIQDIATIDIDFVGHTRSFIMEATAEVMKKGIYL